MRFASPRQVTLIGVGLIGGSIGLALKQLPDPPKVIGLGRRQSSLDAALARGAVDQVSTSLTEAIAGSDLIVVCTPVNRIIEYIKEISKIQLPADCLISDAGSTKQAIVDAAEMYLSDPGIFVAAHPLAGSEKSGVDHAQVDLFKNSRCLITPSERNNAQQLSKVQDFWKSIGCKVLNMSPERHDRLLALTSHLPHLLAPALINLASVSGHEEDELIEIFAGSFKDMTRVAGSDPDMWLDIFFTNKENILGTIDKYELMLDQLKNALKNDDTELLKETLSAARTRRNRIYHAPKKLDR